MPMMPREWIVFECQQCKAVVNTVAPEPENLPSNNYEGRTLVPVKIGGMSVEHILGCPFCQEPPRVISHRPAIAIPDIGMIGGGPDAVLDCLTALTNAVVDIRNQLELKL
jgi:hypothetical protein